MKNRSRAEIIKLILESAAGDGITRSKIMYKSMLGYAQAKEYVSFMLYNGLVEHSDNTTFRTTEKGFKFLELYNQGMNLMNKKYLSTSHLNT